MEKAKAGRLKRFLKFCWNNLIIRNILWMVVAAGTLITIVMYGLDIYTQHGQAIVVPNVTALQVSEAQRLLERHGLKYEIVDSVFLKNARPGAIVEQIPQEGSKVKDSRTIYLTVNAKSARLITVPDVHELSQRQAIAILTGVGFNEPEIEYVNYEYKDLVLDLKYNGRIVSHGDKIPAKSHLTLLVGNGIAERSADSDSISIESNITDEDAQWLE